MQWIAGLWVPKNLVLSSVLQLISCAHPGMQPSTWIKTSSFRNLGTIAATSQRCHKNESKHHVWSHLGKEGPAMQQVFKKQPFIREEKRVGEHCKV